jgi:hypothetical protein
MVALNFPTAPPVVPNKANLTRYTGGLQAGIHLLSVGFWKTTYNGGR